MNTRPFAREVTANDAILWQDDRLWLLDQRVLPADIAYIECTDAPGTADAIRDMVVRGAPAIGITAAYGLAMAARLRRAEAGAAWKAALEPDFACLAASRPTAVNLFWALERMRARVDALGEDVDPFPPLLDEAVAIHRRDAEDNLRMGRFGADLVQSPATVITHCNAGALATGGHGTALGVIRELHRQGRLERVFADETRPWMQGSRLTAWELVRDNIPVSLMGDGAAASRMALGDIGWVIVGSDRIAANGDVANKIGTYSLAVAARHHGVKFMVAAPTSTIDMSLASGADIPIERRDPAELLGCGGTRLAAEGAEAWNPVFDVTPAALVDAIVTEKGVVERPDAAKMSALMGA